jgi:hydrogenase nickel incorporation protein HypA/HybF
MHEYHMVKKLVDDALALTTKAGLKNVSKIVIALGQASGLEEGAVELYFEQICQGTILERAALEFRSIPTLLMCKKCDLAFPLIKAQINCPRCGEPSRDCISGKDAKVEEVLP